MIMSTARDPPDTLIQEGLLIIENSEYKYELLNARLILWQSTIH